ncbi:thioredoxin [Fragilaria crotonensis]|nr:thioredoxin [Fragilaria crotonensis]
MMPRSIQLPFLVLLYTLLPLDGSAFSPSPPLNSALWSIARKTGSQQQMRPLQLVATPFEEIEKEEELDDQQSYDDRDDWTPVSGGFLPRLFRPAPATRKELITEVSTLEDFKREVIDCDEQVVVVKFYSAACRSCKDMAPLYKKLANSLSDNEKVKFVQVPVTRNNAVLHRGLGVPSVPYGHIYHKDGGLVEERKLNKKEFAEFENVLQEYVRGSCEA